MAQAVKTDYKAAQIPVVKNVLCFICKTSPSKYTCKECSSELCKGCCLSHNKRFESENHTVTDIRDTCTVVYCLTHQDEKYTQFCTECSKLICEKCVATDHIGHKISTISSVADDMRHAGEKCVKLLNEKVDEMSESLSCLRTEKLPTFKKEFQRQYAEIDDATQTIYDLLKLKQTMKIKELDDLKINHDDDIARFFKDQDNTLSDMANIQIRLDNVLREKHDATFITSYEYINKDFKQIEQEFGGFDKPEVPNRNLNELILDLLQLINTELDGKNKPNLEELQLQISNVTKEKDELQSQLEEMKIRFYRTEAEHNEMQLQFAQSVKEKDELVQQLKSMNKRIKENLENNMTIKQISTEKEELQLRLKENETRYTELKQTNQKLEDSIKSKDSRFEELEYMSYNAVKVVAMRDEKIAVLDKRVVNLQNDLLKERNASQMFIADISVRMQDWLVKSKEMTTEIEKEAYGNFDSENGMNQHRINVEELKEGFKNLHTNKDNGMGQIETKDSEDKEEPIDQWLRNKDKKLLKVAAKVETELQLQQLNTDVSQVGEKVTVITKHDAGDTDEGSNVSEETTEAEIGDENQVTVHLMNAENTCVWNSNKSSAEELKEGFKNLHTNKDNDMGQIETKDSEDKQEPIDQCLRNKDTKLLKVAAKVETDLQLQRLKTDVSQRGEKVTVITKNDAGDADEGLNVSEETTEAEIGDEKQVTVHLMNAENTCVRNTNNSYKDNHLEFNQSVDIVDSDAVEVETSGELCDDLQIPNRKESEAKHCKNEEDQNVFIGVDKDKNNIQLQKLNMDEVKGNGGGTGITNSDEGDTDEVFYSDETATKGIGDDKEEIAPLRKTGKDYMRNTACRPLSDDFGALPIKERIKLMEKQRFLKKYKSE